MQLSARIITFNQQSASVDTSHLLFDSLTFKITFHFIFYQPVSSLLNPSPSILFPSAVAKQGSGEHTVKPFIQSPDMHFCGFKYPEDRCWAGDIKVSWGAAGSSQLQSSPRESDSQWNWKGAQDCILSTLFQVRLITPSPKFGNIRTFIPFLTLHVKNLSARAELVSNDGLSYSGTGSKGREGGFAKFH